MHPLTLSPAVNFCRQNNGGCATVAQCSQKGTEVSCSCQKGYRGDGRSCTEIDPCADGLNGGCHEHATCRMTGPVSVSLGISGSSAGPAQPHGPWPPALRLPQRRFPPHPPKGYTLLCLQTPCQAASSAEKGHEGGNWGNYMKCVVPSIVMCHHSLFCVDECARVTSHGEPGKEWMAALSAITATLLQI